MSAAKSFGQIVKERRRELGLTQDELARRVGCAAITLRKVEADDLRPSVQIAERLAMALNLPLEERAAFVRLAREERPQFMEPAPTPAPALAEIGGEDLSGRAIRGYALGERIGHGGFGAVYRATQPVVEREVAVKIILPQYANHPEFIRRFEAEAQLVARLEHPHIVPLYDYWREPNVAFLVMRLLRGGGIRTVLEKGPLPVAEVLRLLEQIGRALGAAHRAGVVHRDLKPANVLLDEEQNAYLADFGIVKNLSNPNLEDLTQADAIIGSPAYISPEQIRSEFVRPQTDIYCLGVMLSPKTRWRATRMWKRCWRRRGAQPRAEDWRIGRHPAHLHTSKPHRRRQPLQRPARLWGGRRAGFLWPRGADAATVGADG